MTEGDLMLTGQVLHCGWIVTYEFGPILQSINDPYLNTVWIVEIEVQLLSSECLCLELIFCASY